MRPRLFGFDRFARAVVLLLLFCTAWLCAADHEERKLRLLFVYEEGCPWCAKMEHEVFENPDYLRRIRAHYRLRRAQIYKDPLPLGLEPHLFPTTYVLSSDGRRVLERFRGYIDPKEFLASLDELYSLEEP